MNFTKKIFIICLLLLTSFFVFPQATLMSVIQIEGDLAALRWKKTCIEARQRTMIEPYKTEYKKIVDEYNNLGNKLKDIKQSEEYKAQLHNATLPPTFGSIQECENYRSKLQQESGSKFKAYNDINLKPPGTSGDERYNPAKAPMARQKQILWGEYNLVKRKLDYWKCDELDFSANNTNTSNGLEIDFLNEIQKINSDIDKINNYARSRKLELSLISAQQLCDKIRLLQGRQYFSNSLKEIRKNNPGFSFSITPLADEVTREYWIRMRNRANISYRNALEAYAGCVYNEGIQQFGYVEIPMGLAKATYDLVNSWKDMLSGSLFGTFTALSENSQKGANAVRAMNIVGEEVAKAGGDAYDWKSYAGVLGGFISAYDGYVKTYNMAVENYRQGDLLVMNRESASQLLEKNKLLLQQFDRYRAYIDAHNSSVDCLNDKLMRLNLDNNSIKGDNITIWGTGLYDWDGEEFIAQIKEAGEDLKNEYIYCEDFVKALQMAVKLADDDFRMMEEKVRNSGADQNQINAQLSYNYENGEWFEQESTRLSEYYVQFCENPGNIMPEDVIVVSTQVIPGVEVQDGNADDTPVWEYDDSSDYEEYVNNQEYEPDYNRIDTWNEVSRSNSNIENSGNGWSVQTTLANESSLRNDISNAINSGKTPTGIYVGDNNEVVVYYIDDNPLGMTAWNLEWYNDADALQSGINSNLENGYFPMGISFNNSGKLYVLYIMSDLNATAWQLVESELDLDMVSNNINQYIQEKYIPVGITVFAGMYYTLLAQLPDSEPVKWTIEGYEDNNQVVSQNINSMINQGLIPFGYLKEQGIVNVLYIGF